jgi:hypothetical protein
LYQWQPYNYFDHPISFELDDAINCYKKELRLQKIDVNEVGDHFRVELECRGEVKGGKFMGYGLEVTKGVKGEVVELKRKGIYEERRNRITLRVKDRLVVYLCQVKD